MNLICNTNLTIGGQGKCRCRTNFKWNTEEKECQFYNNVDCSDITYDTAASPTILRAVEKAQQRMNATEACPKPKFLCEDAATCVEEEKVCNGVSDCPLFETGPGGEDEECLDDGSGDEPEGESESESAQTSSSQSRLAPRRQLENSLLKEIDPKKATADEIREAFCRDVDVFSFDLRPASPNQTVRNLPAPLDHDERPDKGWCEKIPAGVCAVAYDSHDCNGGWKLILPEGQKRFKWFTPSFQYRNDMDLIAVRAGCTFTGYTDSDFNGFSQHVTATKWDRWVVFERADSSYVRRLDENIESVKCYCHQSG